MIQGWSEAVPTMRVGEIAKFTICAEKAYGASGSPPKIPANASLDFEIELLSFLDREDVCHDGRVLKKKLSGGDSESWEQPNWRRGGAGPRRLRDARFWSAATGVSPERPRGRDGATPRACPWSVRKDIGDAARPRRR